MKLVSWNVNSLKARMPRVLELLDRHAPDVVCLQETKCSPDKFPALELEAHGYASVDASGGRWAGVAVIARRELEPTLVTASLPDSPVPEEARWIEANVAGTRVVSVYVVNGRSLEDSMYDVKLRFLDAMAARLRSIAGEPVVVSGDFNIAPADIDVYDPPAFEGATHVSPPERERLAAILDAGYVDAFRHLHPGVVQHTWWDYRQGHFHRGRGLRIDLTLVGRALAPRLTAAGIDRDFRKGPKPSDHAPLLVEIDGTT